MGRGALPLPDWHFTSGGQQQQQLNQWTMKRPQHKVQNCYKIVSLMAL